jgi:hypothetical protein
MNLANFECVYEVKDHDGIIFRVWSGPSLKRSFYKSIGVDPERDKIFYLQICSSTNGAACESKLYRFTYEDQTKLLDLVLNNKQKKKAKAEYAIKMVEAIFSWIDLNYWWAPWQIEKITEVLRIHFNFSALKNKPKEPEQQQIAMFK